MKLTALFAGAALLIASLAGAASARGSNHEESPVYGLPAFDEIDGSSATIKRSNGGATVTFNSSGFGPHHAVTMWAISFSNPENCDFGGPLPDGRTSLCGMGDDGAADTGFKIQQLAGHIVGAIGNANFGGHVSVENPLGAEFHVVLADHGPMDPAQLPGQIMSPAGGTQIALFIPS